ncbi:hypothetical protein S245_041399, partial [Arachis hypogaea]
VIDDVKAVQLIESYEERNMTLHLLWNRSPFDCTRICGAQHVWKHRRTISSELLYLEWEDYPFTYFSSCCKLFKLLKLVVQRSNIKQLWDGTICLHNLKELNLSDSKNLVKIPNLSQAPNLEMLFLRRCRKLKHIHPSTGNLRKLVLKIIWWERVGKWKREWYLMSIDSI